MRMSEQHGSADIDDRMPFMATDLLGHIIAVDPVSSRVLDRLAVHETNVLGRLPIIEFFANSEISIASWRMKRC